MMPGEPTPASLVSRLESLERENRSLKVAGAASLAVAGVALLVAAGTLVRLHREARRGSSPVRQTVEAGSFVLRGPGGTAHAVLSLDTGGTARLTFADKGGVQRATLGPNGLQLADKSGRRSIALEAAEDGSASLALFGAESRRAAWLEVLANGSRALSLSDQDEGRIATLDVAADGGLRLILADRHGQRANLTLSTDGSPHLDLSASEGRGGATLGVTTKGAPGLRLFDQGGRAGAALVAADGAAGLRLLDPAGREVAGLLSESGQWPRLFLSPDGNKPAAMLTAAASGAPGLALFDQRGQARAVLGQTAQSGELDDRGIFSVRFFNQNGKLVYQAPGSR